jgi:hypothetical protein
MGVPGSYFRGEVKYCLLEGDGEAAKYRYEHGVMPVRGEGVLGFKF